MQSVGEISVLQNLILNLSKNSIECKKDNYCLLILFLGDYFYKFILIFLLNHPNK